MAERARSRADAIASAEPKRPGVRPSVLVLLALLLVPVVLPLGLVQVVTAPVPLRLVAVAALLTTVVVGVARTARGLVPLRLPAPTWALAALVVVALVATPVGVVPAESVRSVALQLIGLLLALAVVSAGAPAAWLRVVVGVLLASGAVVCAQGALSARALQSSFGGTYVANRAQGSFAQPNDFGSFCAAVFVLALATLLAARTVPARVAGVVCAAVSGYGAVLSLSRGAYLGVVLGLVVLPVLVPELRRRFVVGAVLAVPLAAVVLAGSAPGSPAGVLAARLGTIATGQVSPLDERTAIWAEAVRQFRASPWLGVGPGGYPTAALRAPEPVLTLVGSSGPGGASTATGPDHAHDVLLTTAAEVGLAGPLLVIAATLQLALRARRAARTEAERGDRLLVAGLAGSLATFLAQGLVDYVLRNPLLLLLLWLLVGLLIATCATIEEHAIGGSSRGSRR